MECVLSLVDEGTELRGVLATVEGTALGQVRSPGPANTRFLGTEGLSQRLRDVCVGLMGGRGESLCLAAVAALEADPGFVRDQLAAAVPVDPARVFATELERCAAAGSLGKAAPQRVVVVRSDVGSRAWAVAEAGREVRCAGFGEVLGDEGSAYWIGRAGISAALKAHEKRSRATLLKPGLVEHFGLRSHRDLAIPLHAPPPLDRYQVASFAPAVFEAARQDDPEAVEILTQAGRELAVMALALINELELAEREFSVLPSGSVFRHRGASLESFMKTLRNKTSKANLVKEGLGPAGGGVLLAIRHLGLKERPEIAQALRASYPGVA